MKRILIVEDELNMRLGLKDNLEFEGYEVETAADGAEGLAVATESTFDLIVLDVMMPKMSGFDVCKQLRTKGITTPIILLTAKGEEIDKVLGLELGADDYITKPFSLRELLARIKAILRRSESTPQKSGIDQPVLIGKLEVTFATYSVSCNGKDVQMSPKEIDVLRYLWENRNKAVSRDDLLNNIWGYDENPTTRTVDNFIVRIRQKIESDPNHPKIILTIHGVGYKLITE